MKKIANKIMLKLTIFYQIKNISKTFCFLLLAMCSGLCFAETQTKDIVSLFDIKGELTQGSAIIGKIPIGAKLLMNNQAVSVTKEGDFFIGFGRDADLKQSLQITTASGEKIVETLSLTEREYKLQKVSGVPQNTVAPPSKKNLKRIQQENALVGTARGIDSEHRYFLEKFIAPMDSVITGVYGSRRIYNGIPKRPHYGVDYAGPIGALVYAPASGVVTLAHPDMFYSGGTLIIDHGFGVSSSFLHLSEIVVKEGQEIKQGELIAKVGKGGRATGPHLDWRMNWFDVRIDPLKVLAINKDTP
tara:strand:+ start:9288 stop:10193 length:906 start_codon:yes stop_codon:yes gene_type:complete